MELRGAGWMLVGGCGAERDWVGVRGTGWM